MAKARLEVETVLADIQSLEREGRSRPVCAHRSVRTAIRAFFIQA